jgi:hypothetical protein
MPCDGTYLGGCCEAPVLCASEAIISAGMTFIWTPFDIVRMGCGVPENVYTRIVTETTFEFTNTHYDLNSDEPCFGTKRWGSIVSYVSQNPVCGPVVGSTSNFGDSTLAIECMRFFDPNIENEVLEAEDAPTRIFRRYRSRIAGEVEPDWWILDTTVETRLEGPIFLPGWVTDVLERASAALFDEGFRTTLVQNCSDFTLSRIPITTAPPSAFVRVSVGVNGVVVSAHLSQTGAVRPYHITDGPVPGCPDASSCESFPKTTPEGPQEVDCVRLYPGFNRTMTLAGAICP